MTYEPNPIDTASVEPSVHLDELTERLAQNVHDNWARERLAEGWTWGASRDDRARTHPDLVPYEQLEEAEKELDRRTARETIKALVALGYRIEPPSTDSSRLAVPLPGTTNRGGGGESTTRPAEPPATGLEAQDLAGLLAVWRGRELSTGSAPLAGYRLLAERLRAVGEPLLSYDVIAEGLERWPDDLRLRQLLGLVLADSGAPERANDVLAQLVSEGHEDEETVGMLARTHKDLWARACEPEEQVRHLRRARQWYDIAYRRTGGYWTGINAATLAALQGDESARPIAMEVYDQCLTDLQRTERAGSDRYWPLATLGEACLVLSRWSEAEDWYRQAIEVGRGRGRELSSTLRNARLLLALPGVAEGIKQRIEACFRLPPVMMFAGHMVDRPDRRQPRFPPELEPVVAPAIHSRLESMEPPIAFASAACGADLLFLEAVLDLGGEAHVVLPYDVDQFEVDSVNILPSSDWQRRFRRVLDQATRVVVGSDRCGTASPSIYEYGNLLLRGLATMRASQLEAELRGMVVWDGQSGDGPGGTAALVREWQACGVPTDIIDLGRLAADSGFGPPLPPPRARGTMDGNAVSSDLAIKAMLFADAVGFSRLSEEQVPVFVHRFLGTVGALCAGAREGPVVRNTWGDGLFFVFDTPAAAGRFALDLSDAVAASDWGALGLPPDLGLRIGLHAGPAYPHVDPVTGLANYSGAHVSRAARIEPIAPPGQVYGSEAFAALSAAHGGGELICDYVGQTPLAKGYGTFRMYHVRRRPC